MAYSAPKSLLPVFFILAFCTRSLSAGDDEAGIHRFSYQQHIKVLDKRLGFTSTTEIRGRFPEKGQHREYIPYTELDDISAIRAKYRNSKGKLKDLAPSKIQNSSIIGSTFYDGGRCYLIDYSGMEPEYEFSYTTTSLELMHLNTLLLNSSVPTDSFSYSIEVPAEYRVLFRFPPSSQGVRFDSTVTPQTITYTIISIPAGENKKTPRANHYESFPSADNYVRLLVLPAESTSNPWQYFNEWYLSLVGRQKTLSDENFRKFEELAMKNLSTTDSIPVKIFDFVKSTISYLDIENGLGAYQPRDPNAILTNRQGDCKDMAFLLSELLKRYGYKVRLAPCATLSHIFDFDFPCLASANHVVCVLNVKDQIIILDATEPYCEYGSPGSGVQGRRLFVVDSGGAELIKVDILPASRNKVKTEINLAKKGTALAGSIGIQMNGLSAGADRHAVATLNKHDCASHFKIKYQSVIPALQLDSLLILDEKKRMEIRMTAQSTNSIVINGKKTYITLKFLLFPHQIPRSKTEGTQLPTYQTIENEIDCVLSLDGAAKMNLPAPVTFNKGGFVFNFQITQPSPDKIRIFYTFTCDKVILEPSDDQNYAEVNKLITKTLNTAISYE